MSARLAEYATARLRSRIPAARTVPVDLVKVAAVLGVSGIVLADDMVEDGRLEQRGGTAQIFVSSRAGVERRRYTIAHELGHLLLADPERDTIARRMRCDDDIERFCDAFAAALLLPRDLVLPYRGQVEQLGIIRELAARTRTSLAAVTVRLSEVAGWNASLLHWRRNENGWIYRWGAALPSDVHRRLRSAPTTSQALDLLRANGRQDQAAQVPMLVGRLPVEIEGQLSIRGRSAIGLVHVPNPSSR